MAISLYLIHIAQSASSQGLHSSGCNYYYLGCHFLEASSCLQEGIVMRHRMLEGGAIACSTILLYGGTLPHDVNPDSESCQPPFPATDTPSRPNCSQPQALHRASIIPENLFDLRWGGKRDNRPINELEIVYEDVLEEAQTTANRDRLPEAIFHLGGIPKNSRHYALAKQLQDDWSQELLQRAIQQHHQANLSAALRLLNTISPTSQHQPQAIALAKQWRGEAKLLNQALVARKTGNWTKAVTALKRLEATPLYQSSLVQQMLQEITTKQFEPASDLMQIAADTARINPSLPVRRPRLETVPLPVENPLPQSDLEIATEQALTWAQPPQPKAIATTQPPQPAATPTPSSIHVNPVPLPNFPYQIPSRTASKRPIPTKSTPQPQFSPAPMPESEAVEVDMR
jgi:hypothetical protein